ncbi:MAG TPA: hypothetical protein VI612_04295 [Candidatus Nanoarchaeia archaeon]|nr:hypothetical protein [Candidatus Nanoarchaeia archaeon]
MTVAEDTSQRTLVARLGEESLNLFRKAQDDESSRQGFIDSIVLGPWGKYVSRIAYDPGYFEQKKSTAYMSTDLTKLQRYLRVPWQKTRIRVASSVFENRDVTTSEEFLSYLDHELEHARQFYEQSRKYIPSWIKALKTAIRIANADESDEKMLLEQVYAMAERDAYAHQLRLIEDRTRNVGSGFRSTVQALLLHYQRICAGELPIPAFDPKKPLKSTSIKNSMKGK